MNDLSAQQRPRRSRLVLGIFLLVVGGLLLAVNLGYGLPWGWWQYLPWALFLIGGWGLIVPSRHMDRVGGVWIMAIGLYCLMGFNNWWGLGWSGAWPIFVIAAGLGFILHRHEDRLPPSGNGPSGNGVS
ncbi:hypothetical protein GCM10011487_00950 [Steroidobacter agaridevorans]|uniref:LiaF transmembrane domain-containing protein n=1 Tax=Steroidobacter agaridevorans TaxID=2695856 RepID=A0A829Y510_9GAMM|nr:hypothetical protein [Steroidobacter agaridevorans]GFE78095.1 hypothetical protein GCM10011487_00950 [Steroidobacter agaridevorans]